MDIKRIGRYTIMTGPKNLWKQIYSPHGRMLQINQTKAYYIDTNKMKTLKEFARKLVLIG